MKNLIIIILFFSCVALMFGKIFQKPEQYHYVEGKGYLTQEEFHSFTRGAEARSEYEEFDKQINVWYNRANELLILDDVSDFLWGQLYENANRDNSAIDGANA